MEPDPLQSTMSPKRRFLAALLGGPVDRTPVGNVVSVITQDLMEAAAIDGAGPVRRFFNVTLPLLSPTVFFLSIAMVLSSMQAFDILRIMTPTGNGTNTIVFEIYLQSFGTYQRAGYAAAISVVLFVTLFAITAIQMRYVERKVHYS